MGIEVPVLENPLEFGTRVRYDHALERKWGSYSNGGEKVWEREEVMFRDAWKARPDVREGVIVGKRLFSDGAVSWTGYDGGGFEYAASRYFWVYLVAWDMRRSLDRVLPEDVCVTTKT